MRSFIAVLALLLLAVLLIQTEWVQNLLVQRYVKRLARDLKTEIQVKRVSIGFFDRLNAEGVLIRDQQKDTLLYAGVVKVRLTDWFFLTNQLQLTYVGLEDALITQQRSKDTVWNHQFVLDYFRSDKPRDSTKKALELDLKKVDLKNVRYRKLDGWKGENMMVSTRSLVLNAERLDLKNNIFTITDIDLDRPQFELTNFRGLRPDSLRPKKIKNEAGPYFNTSGLQVRVGSIVLRDGLFASTAVRPGDVVNRHFDGNHIRISKLDGSLRNISFLGDTIRFAVDLKGQERSGFQLKKLKADFRLTPQIMEFANLDLRSSKSQLGSYYAMKFTDFNEDFAEYIDQVVMDARFSRSVVHSDDVAYFAPELRTWKKRVDISGRFLGTVADFTVNNLVLRNESTTAAGDLSMKGLPNVDQTLIGFRGRVNSSYSDVALFVPPVRRITTPDLAALGQLQYVGSFNGLLTNFRIDGTLNSNLGAVYAKASLVLPENGEPRYKGQVITEQFNLGKFIRVAKIGEVSFRGEVDGVSFDVNKLNSRLAGAFSSFAFNGYRYRDLKFDGQVRRQNFTGDFSANDSNFNFTSNVAIDFSGATPKINLLGDLVYSNLRRLNFLKQDLQLTGLFDLNFQGRNIDEFLGSVKILNASLRSDSVRLNFDSLYVNSFFDPEGRRNLTAESNEFSLAVRGKYNLLDLPNSFQYFLNRYLPNLIAPPKTMPKDQAFVVRFNTRNFDQYARALDGRLGGLDSASIVGGVNTADTGTFYMNAQIPYVRFQQYSARQANLRGVGSNTSLDLEGQVGRVNISDSFFFPNTTFRINTANDRSSISLKTAASKLLNEAELNAEVYTLEDGVRINFQPSSFVLNDKKWDLEKEGEVVIRKSFASANNVQFRQGSQQISVESVEDDGGSSSNLVVKLSDVSLGDFLPMFVTKPRMEGVATGNVYLRDFFNVFKADGEVQVQQFRLDNDSLGIVNLKLDYDNRTKLLAFDASSPSEQFKFAGKGQYNLGKPLEEQPGPLTVDLNLENSKIGILNSFLGSLFSDIKGLASGPLRITGNFDKPVLEGEVTLRDASLKVKYTQVTYKVPLGTLRFTPDYMDFGELEVQDEAGRRGTITGRLYQRGFENFRYDLAMSTDGMLLLNTKAKDNPLFYGVAVGRASLTLTGDETDMRMYVQGEVTDQSYISVKTDGSSKNADADFIVYKQYGTEITVPQTESSALNIELDLRANNKAQIDVILDEASGDIIQAWGNGRMLIKVPAVGDVSMNGRYNIERGNYNFNFQSFIRKPFVLRENAGNYIEWKGSPYDAIMKVDAQFTAENVSLNDLFTNTPVSLSGAVRAYRGEVYVIASLNGKLSAPDIDFRLDFPPNTSLKYDDTFNRFLTRLQSDNNELLKQVTWLIVFGSFAPYGEGLGAGGGASTVRLNSIGINTISQRLTNEVNKIVSNALFKLTGDRSLTFDVSANTYSSSTLLGGGGSSNRLDRQQVNFKINKSILDNRIVVVVGSDFDFNVASAGAVNGNTSGFQWLPDISVQFVLNDNRTLRAVIFNKSTLDVSNTSVLGRRNRQGVSLNFSRDFNRLFGGKRRGDSAYAQPYGRPSQAGLPVVQPDTLRRVTTPK